MGFKRDVPKRVPAPEKSIGFSVYVLDTIIVQVFYKNELNRLLNEIGEAKRRCMFFQYLQRFIEFTMMMINNIYDFNHSEIHLSFRKLRPGNGRLGYNS
jgi:hypothetical protein